MKKLLIILIALGLLWLIAYFCAYKRHAPAIQGDLSTKVENVLMEKGLVNVDVDVNGRDVTLTGTVSSLEQKQLAGKLAAVDGHNFVDNSISIAGETSPFPLSRNSFAGGDTQLESSGRSSDAANPNFNTNAKESESPWKSGSNENADKPLSTNKKLATLMNDQGKVTLTGSVTKKSRRRLLASAHGAFGKANVINDYSVVAKDDAEAVKLMDMALGEMDQVTKSQISVDDGALTVSVASPFKDVLARIEENLLEDLPEGTLLNFNAEKQTLGKLASASQLTRCQKLFTPFARKQIIFSPSSSRIQKRSFKVLNKISTLSKQCAGMMIEVHGHTDSLGRNSINKALSKQRALSVKQYLVDKGVAHYFVKTIGHGEANPISSNRTKKGRARNRRIEFNVEKVTK